MEKAMNRKGHYVFDDIVVLKAGGDIKKTYIDQLDEILQINDSEEYENDKVVKFVNDKYITIDPNDSRDDIIAKMAIRKMLYVDVFVHRASSTVVYFRKAKGEVPELPLLALATAAVFSRSYDLERDMCNNNIEYMASAALNIENQKLDRTQIIEAAQLRATFKDALGTLEESWKREYLK